MDLYKVEKEMHKVDAFLFLCIFLAFSGFFYVREYARYVYPSKNIKHGIRIGGE